MLDDIDREAMREGAAISKVRGQHKKVVIYSQLKKGKPEPTIDVLRILNILQGVEDEPARS